MKYQFICVYIMLKIIAQQILTEPVTNSLGGQNELELNCHLKIHKLMNFLYGNQCVQIILDKINLFPLNCIADIMRNSENITVYTRTVAWMLKRNIYEEKIISTLVQEMSTRYCENFLIFLENIPSIPSIITTQSPKNRTQNFYPFSKIYFMIKHLENSSFKMTTISDIFHSRSLFGYILEMNYFTNAFTGVRDLITLDYAVVSDYQKTNLIHPFVDKKNAKKIFRISFHECYPYVIYRDEQNLRFDGTEYRLVEEVVKNWKVEYLFRDWSKTNQSPYVTMYNDLLDHSADIAMCAVWLSDHGYKYDLTTFHSHECHSMLVPKPTKLSEVTAIYTTLSVPVWILFGVCLIMTAMLLWGIAKTKITRNNVYISLNRTFLDIANLATSHGIDFFPEQKSAKILLISWILLSMWIGICYSTIYTSRLTSPGFTKIIDTLEEFISNDLYWGTYFLYPDIGTSLKLSANPAYHQLYQRIHIFNDSNDAESRLKSGKCCVLGGVSRNRYLISYDWSNKLHLFTSFRLMKKVCILNYYSIFPLQKFSAYTDLFSEQALRYQEHGFSEYWYSVIYREKRWYDTFFEDYPLPDNEPKALTFASIIGALMILFLNLILSTVVFMIEIMVERTLLQYFSY